MQQRIHWFEIPALHLERAVTFYQQVFQLELRRETFGASHLAVFPYVEGATGGCLCQNPALQPGPHGVLIYLDGGDDLAQPLARVISAGGEVVQHKTALPHDMGFIATFRDSEGNVVGLHSMH